MEKHPENQSNEGKPKKNFDFFYFFWIPTLINLAISIYSLSSIKTNFFLPLTLFLSGALFFLIGFIIAVASNMNKGGYMMLSGIVGWIIGASTCGIAFAIA